MTDWKARRFWDKAEATETSGSFTVTLDGRAVKTPAKSPLVVPTMALAREIAAEWDAQDKEIDPLSMPFTRSANAAIDKVATQHAEVAEMLAAYGDADLLCYRADSPAELIARQTAAWDPLLDWADSTLGARLIPVSGVLHHPQSRDALDRLHKKVAEMDAFTLTAFHDLVSLSGSLVIGFAALMEQAPINDLWVVSRVDEDWQIDQWGEDDEATEQAEIKRQAFLHAKKFCETLRHDA